MPSARIDLLLVLLGSAAVIGGALLFQYVGGLAPCELCLLERWPYYIGMPLAVLVILAGGQRNLLIGGSALVMLLFLASSGLAFYHVGVEQHWFAGPTACTGGSTGAKSLEDLRAQLMATKPVRCDEPQWTLFGVSLAGFNLLASLVLMVLAILALRDARGRRTA
jgi:disulfide bond formation protein DsbB